MNPVWFFLNGNPQIGPLSIQQTTITLTGPALFADGSASAPSIGFANQAGLGLYRVGTDRMAMVYGSGTFGLDVDGSLTRLILNSGWSLAWGSSGVGTPDTFLSRGAANVLTLASGDSFSIGGAPAAATTAHRLIKKVTGMGDGSAVDVITVTVPNANHSAGIKVTLLSANGGTDAFESSRVAEGFVVLARTSGVNTVPAVAALDLAQIATVGSGATHTLAYGVSAVSGLSSATQTFTITVTVNDSGNVGSNQVICIAELINSEATGVTMA